MTPTDNSTSGKHPDYDTPRPKATDNKAELLALCESTLEIYTRGEEVYPGKDIEVLFARELKRRLTDNKDAGVSEREKKLLNIGARLAGCLWDYHNICPECGNTRQQHMPGCKKTYEREFRSPADCEKVFANAFNFAAYEKEEGK